MIKITYHTHDATVTVIFLSHMYMYAVQGVNDFNQKSQEPSLYQV